MLARWAGRIVAVASMAGLIGVPTRTGYSAAKHAVVGFFDSLRVELLDSGVSVSAVIQLSSSEISMTRNSERVYSPVLSGEKPIGTKARTSIANFKLR